MSDFVNFCEFMLQGTTSILTDSLLEEDRSCEICYEKFDDQSAEWPLRIETCGHVFGNSCLLDHVRGGQAYSNKCPKCRAILWDDRPPSIIAHLISQTERRIIEFEIRMYQLDAEHDDFRLQTERSRLYHLIRTDRYNQRIARLRALIHKNVTELAQLLDKIERMVEAASSDWIACFAHMKDYLSDFEDDFYEAWQMFMPIESESGDESHGSA